MLPITAHANTPTILGAATALACEGAKLVAVTEKSLTELLSAYFDAPRIESFSLMTQGAENHIYVVNGSFGKLIVRVWGDHSYMGRRLESDINGELDFMEACNKAGVPTPGLYRSKAGNRYELTPEGRWYAVTSYVEGDCPTSFTADMASQLATEMARMHLLVRDFEYPAKRSWPGTVIEMAEARIAPLPHPETGDQHSLREIIDSYHERLQQTDLSTLPIAAIHGDIMRENIKFEDGALSGIFDFDDCRTSYFLEDIAKSVLFEFDSPERSLFGHDGSNARVFVEAYESVRPLNSEERKSLPLFFTARYLFQAANAYEKSTLSRHVARHRENEPFFRSFR